MGPGRVMKGILSVMFLSQIGFCRVAGNRSWRGQHPSKMKSTSMILSFFIHIVGQVEKKGWWGEFGEWHERGQDVLGEDRAWHGGSAT